ncbi:hypothetical protein Zmor_002492 [Zophobas morio]|uniref:Uncharacterized protein n=1 Tax=Zophobas morio TaxID=2755281 RepID=A0AA38J5G1_9CUCU|nr:hypothetical protein Zmor_002490 [Zophobas morio]KAJ3667085.1 hypothetical protein Zmor_002492 [Zophobas morio]
MNRRKNLPDATKGNTVGRAHSTLSVSAVDYYLNLPVSNPPSPAISTVTLTPGRIRNIDQDMEALRASRQDNPFIQQIIASRESLIDSLEEESDHANLMSKELSIDLDVDPLTLPEMHEHMIRSPPPTTWPKSPNFKIFQFPNGEEETLHVELNTKDKTKSDLKPKHSSWDGSETSPLKSLSKSHHHHHHQDMLSLLTPNSLRASGEDSIHLMAED